MIPQEEKRPLRLCVFFSWFSHHLLRGFAIERVPPISPLMVLKSMGPVQEIGGSNVGANLTLKNSNVQRIKQELLSHFMKCEAVMMNPFIFMVFFDVMMFDDMYLSLCACEVIEMRYDCKLFIC